MKRNSHKVAIPCASTFQFFLAYASGSPAGRQTSLRWWLIRLRLWNQSEGQPLISLRLVCRDLPLGSYTMERKNDQSHYKESPKRPLGTYTHMLTYVHTHRNFSLAHGSMSYAHALSHFLSFSLFFSLSLYLSHMCIQVTVRQHDGEDDEEGERVEPV